LNNTLVAFPSLKVLKLK